MPITNVITTPIILRGLVVGEYGKTNAVTLKDFAGVVQNVSSYTSLIVISSSPDGKKKLNSTGAFATDGADGVVTWSYTSGVFCDRPGLWLGQAQLSKTGELSKTYCFEMEVDKSL